MDNRQPCRILITGASSGIGAALARDYAGAGVALYLGGRNQGRLDAVALECRAKGAAAEPRSQDVTDALGMRRWISDAFAGGPLDVVIANAGVAGEPTWSETAVGDGGLAESTNPLRKIMEVNFRGTVNTVFPAIEGMLSTPLPASGLRGQIAIMGSLAGFRGLPNAPAYCASKAALRTLAESLRGLLRQSGIRVSVICPGFVKSPMTDGAVFPMPFLISAERAAVIIRKGLARDRACIGFPWPLYAAVRTFSMLPPGWHSAVLRRLSAKRPP